MSGHSKWSTIKRQKGAADIKRGMTFTKIANAITIATKLGGSGDPDANPKLRVVFDSAKAFNMPKENVQRAIDRGLGKVAGLLLEEVVFEGFGPLKTAFLIESVTDNKLRTLQEIRNLFERAGGALAKAGSVSYMFDQKGEIKIKTKGSSLEDELLELIDLGAEEVEDFLEENIQKYLIYVESPKLITVSNKIAQVGFEVEESRLIYKPNTLVQINNQQSAKKVLDFAQKLEEHDDVQKVYANFEII